MRATSQRVNDSEVREELERLHAASFGWALACCRRNREDAEDALQASYLKILQGKASFDGRSRFKTFLFGVIARTAAEQRRAQWLSRLLLARWRRAGGNAPPFDGSDPEGSAARSSESQRLLAALRTLSSRQRQVVELIFYHDLTVEEAARVLGVSVGSARVHYARAKRHLGRVLGD